MDLNVNISSVYLSLSYLQASPLFTIGSAHIPVELFISKRARNLRLTFNPEKNRVRLTLPRFVSVSQGKHFAESKKKWIEKQWKDAQQESLKTALRQYQAGGRFYYLGEIFELNLCSKATLQLPCACKPLTLKGSYMMICLAGKNPLNSKQEEIKKLIENFYRQKAAEVIHDRLEYFNEYYGFKYGRVAFRNQKTRWGSCTAKGDLSFNWRLIMAPIDVIDYVVIHELCHLKHLNHSLLFWNLVSKMSPEFKTWKKWLIKNKILLTL